MSARNVTEQLLMEAERIVNMNIPTVAIANYLKVLCETDRIIAGRIALPCKSLEKCIEHVEKQARVKCGTGRGWIDDQELYQMAVDYYRAVTAEETEPDGAAIKAPKEINQYQLSLF